MRARVVRGDVLRAVSIGIVMLAACGGGAAKRTETPPANRPVALVERAPTPVRARGTVARVPVKKQAAPVVAGAVAIPGVDPRQVELLEQLVAASSGAEQVELQVRLFDMLDRDPARRADALAVAAAALASPDFAKASTADLLLYGYGEALRRAGRMPEASSLWKRLIQDYPSSRFVPDVYLAFGEHHFEANDLAMAEAFYQKATQFPSARAATYARYKLAWVHFNLGRQQDALAGFVAVAAASKDPLRREALKDAVRVYADIGDPTKALPFFQRIDPAAAGAHVLRLASHYADIGKYAEATVAYQAALPQLAPDDACRARIGLLEAAVGTARRPAIVTAIETFATTNVPVACAAEAEALVTRIAVAWQVEQQRTKGDPSDAIRAWEAALDVAQTDAARRDAAHASAELRWQRAAFGNDARQWIETADAFQRLAALGDPSAEVAIVDAWTNALRLDPRLAPQARVPLARIAATPGPARARARVLLDTLP